MTRNGLYRFVVLAALVGYLFIGYLFHIGFPYNDQDLNVCLFKRITTLPCPSCGATHSIMYLIHGDFNRAFMENPLGIILAICLLVFPLWVLFDWIKSKDNFFLFYKRIETLFRMKTVAIPAIAMLLINWIWNIHKGL
jgi:hypothetical protein